MNEPQQEVIAEATTAPESSAGDTTQQPTEAAEPQKGAEAEVADQTVPYSRFKEKIDEANQLKAKVAEYEAQQNAKPEPQLDEETRKVQDAIKQLGFVSKEEIEDLNRTMREDAELEKTLSTLEKQYDGSDGRPKFKRDEIIDYYVKSNKVSADPEVLYKLKHEKELMNWAVQQASLKSKGVESEVSDGSGSKNAGSGIEDLRKAAESGDKEAHYAYLKAISFGK